MRPENLLPRLCCAARDPARRCRPERQTPAAPACNVCYLEFGKFSNNLHYVDYERLPIEELSENGGSIPHNQYRQKNGGLFFPSSCQLGGNAADSPQMGPGLQ